MLDRSEVNERFMWTQCDCGACFQVFKQGGKVWDAEASMRAALEHMIACPSAAEEKTASIDAETEVVTTLVSNVREFFDEKGWSIPSRLEGPRSTRRRSERPSHVKKDPRNFYLHPQGGRPRDEKEKP